MQWQFVDSKCCFHQCFWRPGKRKVCFKLYYLPSPPPFFLCSCVCLKGLLSRHKQIPENLSSTLLLLLVKMAHGHLDFLSPFLKKLLANRSAVQCRRCIICTMPSMTYFILHPQMTKIAVAALETAMALLFQSYSVLTPMTSAETHSMSQSASVWLLQCLSWKLVRKY